MRVRIRDDHAYITIKGPSADGGLSRYEFETEIPVSDAEDLMLISEPGKEMRFAAVQIPAKIGVHSLNGENLMCSLCFAHLQTVRRSSHSFTSIS